MPSEDDLRQGLHRLAERAPDTGRSDLWIARDLGSQRLRQRRLRQGSVLTLAFVAALGAIFALNARDSGTVTVMPASPDITVVTLWDFPLSSSTTNWSAPVDDPTQPSPIAIAVDREQWVVPDSDYIDCGVYVRTGGWPTTFIANPSQLDCFFRASGIGLKAQYISTGRDFTGGMTGTIYRVIELEGLIAIEYEVASDGTLTTTRLQCDEFRPDAGADGIVCVR